MNYCTSCGTTAEEGQKFCSNCGTVILGTRTTSVQSTQANGNRLSCPNCGHVVAKVAKECPNCANKLKMSGTFTYIMFGILFLFGIASGQYAPALGFIFIGFGFVLLGRLVKKRYDRKLSICYGNIIQHRRYEDSFFDELILEVKENNGLVEKEEA